jgi:hypothetical protein
MLAGERLELRLSFSDASPLIVLTANTPGNSANSEEYKDLTYTSSNHVSLSFYFEV